MTTHVTGKPRAVEVRLYSDVNHLRGAATRHSQWSGKRDESFAHAVGVCHGFTRSRIGSDGEWHEDETVAIIRLAATHISPLIVIHEAAHAAQHIYGLDYDDGKPLEDHMHSGNEDFAHLMGELAAAIWGIFAAAADE
ncbi:MULTISPECIES: hypothetical protein [Microbacterium]|uniref:hypothetical protein n=1 Tax=Microbacterium TaxID=33882 RepID=UPI001C2BFB1F|nr:hypothetical protein [Microbacterium paraoxydans]QXE28936.1 hypothetical protein IZR02_11095 [Microbacterium paraoxydans]